MIGLSTSLVKGGMTGRTYVKDGLKLYMPYRGSDASEVKFVGTGSTSFDGSNDYVKASANMGDLTSGTGASFVYDKVDESLGSDEAENNTAATNSSRTEADATGGWNATGMSGGTYESVSTEPQDGSYHLRVLNSTGGSHGFRDTNVTLTNGAYKLMFDYKIISGANLKVRVKDNGDTLIVSFTNLSSTSWSNDNIIYFQSTESGTSAAIYFVTHSGNGEFYVDNIRLYPVNGNVGALI